MRSIYLLPLTALVAVAAGCRSEVREQLVGSAPERDLTLVAQTPEVTIASPVEMQQPRIQRRTARPSSRAAQPAASRSSPLEAKVQLAAVAVTPPVALALPAPANDRELLPGKTVTLIPASTGSSAGPDETEALPEGRGRPMVVRGGGRCRGGGRGPGIGIAGAPRPDFR